MKDKKAAKKIIKRAKKHPEWYTKQDVKYAKFIRKREKQHEREVSERNARRREDDVVRSEGKQPKQPKQSSSSRITRILYKAWSLVGFRASTHDSGDRDN